jgi:hypothetical protein
MKAKTSSVILALCFVLLIAQSALPQAASSRPRRMAQVIDPSSPALASTGEPLLESLVPRDGLRFYFEVRNGGLAQLARTPGALAPIQKFLTAGGAAPAGSDLAGFAMKNMSALSSARIAVVGYGASGQALLIEAANADDAERLGADVARLFAGQGSAKSDLSVDVRDRVVMAGVRAAVNKVGGSESTFTLVEDREFQKAQAHFSAEPFFAYLELGAMPIPWPTTGDSAQNAAYTAGMLAAASGMPYAMAVGGSFEADAAKVRALLLFNQKQSGGLFSSLMSSARLAQPQAPGFAAPNTDLLIDLMIDWEKLYEGIESLFAMVAGAQPAGNTQPGMLQGGDILAMMESKLGFSIKNDLLPTLGGEVAIGLAGFDEIVSAQPKQSRRRVGGPSFTVMIALKDPLKFEKYFNRLFSGMGGATAQPFARAPYRGATISYNRSMAYAISGGFFIAGGSAAQIRRALDARAAGASLAQTPEYNQAMGGVRPVMMQVYVSSGAAKSFFKAISTQAAKVNPGAGSALASGSRSAIGVTIVPDKDGLMLDARVPVELAVMALASVISEKPAPYGINSQTGRARRTPTLTDEDLKARRP